MKNTLAYVALAAPLVAALKSSSSGGALVINYCNQEMPLQNIPATTAGVENAKPTSKVLSPPSGGDNTYFTPWTALNCDGGWSIKVAPNDNWNNIYQYEYTWQKDDQIWLDMSFVNGIETSLPKWEFECSDCATKPHNNAYQHPTDDLNGMQVPVGPSVTYTLLLCPETSGAASAPTATSAAAPTTTPETTAAAPSTTLETYASSAPAITLKQAAVQTPAAEIVPSATVAEPFEIATVYETKIVTAVVTETAHAKKRRHEHRHPHGHSF